MTARLCLVVGLIAAFCLPMSGSAQDQSIPKPAHGKKKSKTGYDYDQSQYKAYHALNGQSHYRFDKDGNPVDSAPKKVATKGKRKKKASAAGASTPAAPAEFAHAHFASSVANPDAPPASGAPRSDGAASGAAPVAGASCQGDTCSQPPGQ